MGPLAAEAAEAMKGRASATRVHVCRDAKEAGDVFESLVVAGDRVWIKGSRSVGLERVVERLCAALCDVSVGA